jgi:poly-gamma-glutamate synthesis protein (capsule biosynthesis protein)
MIAFLLAVLLLSGRLTAADSKAAQTIPPQFTGKPLFLSAIRKAVVRDLPQRNVSGITVPHHLLARDLIARAFVMASRGSYKRVVVISPDHYNLGRTDISVADGNFATVFGVIETDRALTQRLTELPSVSASDFFYREHGIQAILPFVRYFFPRVPVVAVTFKERTKKKDLDAFIDVLETVLNRNTLIVQSTDFSHYLPAEVANVKDAETIAIIGSGEPEKVFSLRQSSNLDSRAAQYVQMRLQKDLFGASPEIIDHRNSQDYAGEKLAKTTSYITQIYVPHTAAASIVAVGDVMLGRSVETLMNKYGSNYPFKEVSEILGDAGAVIGNLEGPINSEHVHTAKDSLTFSFSPAASRALAENHFAVLSLANNHTYDFGEKGFKETRRYLEDQSIVVVGHPKSIGRSYVYTRGINGRRFSFVSLNATSYFDERAARAIVREVRKARPETFLIVLIHWGAEYSLIQNASQRSLAHGIIGSGADLIVGSHPHVVQGIESYQGRLIFYSLGNFIFDQYFSRETQEGLMVRLEITGNNVDCRLIPIVSTRSQPRSMPAARTREWLTGLASRSSPSLKNQILYSHLQMVY